MQKIFNQFKYDNVSNVYGLTDELKVLYILEYVNRASKNSIVLTSSLYEASKFYRKLKTYTDNVFFFPMDEFLTSVAIATSPEFKAQRLDTLDKIINNDNAIVVTNLTGFLKHLPSKSIVTKTVINLDSGNSIQRDVFIEMLDKFGYRKESLVTSTGEYSVRGYIIDVFPFNYENPIRIELFGNQIENIRSFDNSTQLKIDDLDNVKILPFTEIISSNHTSLYSFLDNPTVFQIDAALLENSYQQLTEEMFEYKTSNNISQDKKYMYEMSEIHVDKQFNLNNFDYSDEMSIRYDSENIESFENNINIIKDFFSSKSLDYKINIAINDKESIIEFLINKVNLDKHILDSIEIHSFPLNEGFILDNYIYISEKELLNKSQKFVEKSLVKVGTKIKSFSDIQKGDYVVHVDHGIGVYGGVKTLKVSGYQKDYVVINYKGTDKIYVPVEKITSIYKYSDGNSAKPRISNLDNSTWEKTKKKVKDKIASIYNDLVNLYTERAKVTVPPYLSFPEEELFAREFSYVLTKDQEKCILEINQDLEDHIPMDRLLCGDVGYGKTEVAFRGMFKTVMNGFQVAYLCPTTILSKQQYQVAKERFAKFNLNIELLNRFTSQKDAARILEELESGKTDIVFGTHRLLNKKIKYFDLGLLVIDEEQRFGVMQKEKIKEIKTNVNVLTLSATPIPRTLKMSMSGLKDLSLLDTPPQNRHPVQTYVIEENDLLIKDIIYKEVSRGGQVYILFNDVKNIMKMHQKIADLVPDLAICHAHGQMNKTELENVLEKFIEKEYDVLICSTIIETGMDIPNVNSLIIINAQNFGLSQLYQLRGRVGRSTKVGYCYLMYSKNKTLTETAIKRLNAIKEFTELGSGYKIALRDLSIRGAGELLGSEQAGYIDSVGFNLYSEMIKEVIDEIKETVKPVEQPKPLLMVDTHISSEYVLDENVRIEIHNLINNINDNYSLFSVKQEIEDRFGVIDEKLEIYMYEEWFEKLSQKIGINKVNQTKEKVELVLPPEISENINGEKLFLEVYNINDKFKLKYQRKMITISLNIKEMQNHFIYDFVKLLLVINDMVEENI